MAKVYAVKKGHKTGIFYSWPECQESIKGYSGAEFKSFPTEDDAIAYLGGFVDEKPMSNVIECKRDKECNIFVIGSFDNTKQIGGFGIRLESLRMKQDYYIGVLPNEEKGSVIYSEVLGSLVALQLAKELGYKVIRLYANNEGIVKWAEHLWLPKDKLKIKFCDYCDMLQKDKNNTVSFFTLEDKYIKKMVKVLAKRGLICEEYVDINKVLDYNITEKDVIKF